MTLVLELPENLSFLVVDESEAIRTTVSAGLKALGFRYVTQATSSLSACEILKNRKIDFVICELEMPLLNGVDLLKEIRDSNELNKIAFLMMSGSVTKVNIALLAEYEIDGFLKKPFTLQALAQKLPICMQSYNNTNSIESKFQEAKSMIQKYDYEIAVNKYQLLLKKVPNSCRARVGLAICYRMMRNYQKAETMCRQAIEKNPVYVQAYDELGKIYVTMNKIEESIKVFRQAVTLSPSNPLRFERITSLLVEKQRFKEAELFMESAASNGIVYTNLNEQFAKILFYQKKLEKAAIYFEKALINDPNNRSLINLMGICLKDLNRYDDALKYYNMAIKAYPTDTKVLFNKALCFIEMKKFDKAKKLCEYILTLEPTNQKVINKIQEINLKCQ
ncbi:tetratricopeptide repeat protein [Pigmentibacter ruber]|uniref:tetratricopeptide repeat protein n=1 Tax=Pigmentibacter ruber TaxID=2683196 RepID=UPI00131D38AF|nr:tetratricopeptide repeat protein [Pigmentibacter ruber]